MNVKDPRERLLRGQTGRAHQGQCPFPEILGCKTVFRMYSYRKNKESKGPAATRGGFFNDMNWEWLP